MSDLNLKLFPWDEEGAEPDFINDEGFEWWIDKSTTKWCYRDFGNNKPLEAVVFYVRKNGNTLSRVLIDKKTNMPLHDDTSLEGMATKIDMLRLTQK